MHPWSSRTRSSVLCCVTLSLACSVDLDRTLDSGQSPPVKSDTAVTPADQLVVDGDSAAQDRGNISDGDAPREIVLFSAATDVVVATLLTSRGVEHGDEARVVVADGIVVGATSVEHAAISTGDLTVFGRVTLVVQGSVQGAGGASNGGRGGNAMEVTSTIWLHVTKSGAIRAGGGGGGHGGDGGDGAEAGAWSSWQYSEVDPKTFWSPTWDEIAWNGARGIAVGQMCCAYAFEGGMVYEKGAQKTSSPLPILFEVRRATLSSGEGGSGGEGGLGAGYGHPKTAGTDGASGTHRSGAGGVGGAGGAWGKAGDPGGPGKTGLVYSATSSSKQIAGGAGSDGGAAGIAVYGPGVTVHFRREGTVEGPTDFVAVPW